MNSNSSCNICFSEEIKELQFILCSECKGSFILCHACPNKYNKCVYCKKVLLHSGSSMKKLSSQTPVIKSWHSKKPSETKSTISYQQLSLRSLNPTFKNTQLFFYQCMACNGRCPQFNHIMSIKNHFETAHFEYFE